MEKKNLLNHRDEKVDWNTDGRKESSPFTVSFLLFGTKCQTIVFEYN